MKKHWLVIAWDIEGSHITGPYEEESTAGERARDAVEEDGATHAGYFPIELTMVASG